MCCAACDWNMENMCDFLQKFVGQSVIYVCCVFMGEHFIIILTTVTESSGSTEVT